MHTLKLTAVHRILLSSMLNEEGKAGSHTLSDLYKMMKLSDVLDFKENERKKLNIRTEDGKILWNSREAGDPEGNLVDLLINFEVSDEQKNLLCDIFKKRDEKKEFGLANLVPIVELAEQLGYKIT